MVGRLFFWVACLLFCRIVATLRRVGGSTMLKVLEYEQNAAECRRKASQSKTPQQKKQLEEMAEVWERLARERRQGIVEKPDQR